jgi:phosphoribosyl-dephospho-CoA transferase
MKSNNIKMYYRLNLTKDTGPVRHLQIPARSLREAMVALYSVMYLGIYSRGYVEFTTDNDTGWNRVS